MSPHTRKPVRAAGAIKGSGGEPGGNYFISTRQALETEKMIRVKNISKFTKMTLKEIKEKIIPVSLPDVTETFAEELESLGLNAEIDEHADEGIVGYVAGYSARSISKTSPCKPCVDLVMESLCVPEIRFQMPDRLVVEEEIDEQAKERLIRQVNRGGLVSSTDLCYLTCRIAWNFYKDMVTNEPVRKKVFASVNSHECLLVLIYEVAKQESSEVLEQKCTEGHSFDGSFKRLCSTMFNMCLSNYTQEVNDVVHEGRKRVQKVSPKSGPRARKAAKLQSAS